MFYLPSSYSAAIVFAAFAFVVSGCPRSGTKEENDKAAAAPPQAQIDPALARALGHAMQPCIAAHKFPKPTLYTGHLRLERGAAGTATAMFLPGRTPGHEDFESCAVKAINAAAIQIPQTTTLPVAFDFGPEH
ncbi:MAG TPA: hypothetical protein VN903_22150 [Polyangia bacterium]|nr:hypothetical protein [Polyangia bacterium]